MIADVDRLIVGESAGLECKTACNNAGKEKTGLKYLSACDFLKIRVAVKGNE